MKANRIFIFFGYIVGFLIILSETSNAQYFGQNKPIYRKFKYDVYQSPNFEIYHYFKNDSVVNRLAQAAEQWYNMHQQVFRDTIRERNPLIFYANHADFQQTTAIFGSVGVGTGGVTEALKNRVVIPVTETWAQTDHVLGHELVHAFQFNAILNSDSTNINSLQNLPLWMIEGMAEYLSIGSIDSHTAMWMRDAVLNNDFPTLQKMTRDPNYFPYRYGHAFWSFVGRTFGDSLIVPIFLETAKRGYDIALRKYLGFDEKEFSNLWKHAYIEHYKMIMKDSVDSPSGKKIIDENNAGTINISPVISPNGKYIAFYSEKNLFSIDLFLADAATGKILHKISSTVHRNEIDALNFIESAGTWSPDSKYFAFVAFSKGKNRLLIVDAERSKMHQEIEIPTVPSFNYPAWSTDGKSIVLSGLVDGQNDLFQYFFEDGSVKRLTLNSWCNIHPNWSVDGKTIVYVTDKPSNVDIYSKRTPGYYIATLDTETGVNKVHHFFPGASNLNPVFSSSGEDIYFLSDRDGFRNLYRFNLQTGKIFQETKILTGISGMTKLSPAFSVSADSSNSIAYSYYFKGNYSIYTAKPEDLWSEEVFAMMVDLTAATLPPLNRSISGIIDSNLAKRMAQPETPTDSFSRVAYRPKFKLDYISNMGVGVSSGQMGTGMSGGVEMLFSDIIGANLFHVGLALNGEIYDFGGQLTYINQKNRVIWATTASHIPYSYGYMGRSAGWISDGDGNQYFMDTLFLYHIRMFETTLGAMAQFPISKTRRIETSSTVAFYNYRVDVYSHVYVNGYYYGSDREKEDAPDGFSLQRLNLAYVVDNSSFGIASPMDGARRRFQVDKVFGEYNYWGTLFDFRKYFFVKPFSFAFKAYYYGRHGSNLDNLYSLYLGYPWLIRGYDRVSYSDFYALDYNYIAIDQLTGNHMAIANVEIRLPFTGPERLTVFKSKFLYTELALFADAGLAWYKLSDIDFKWQPEIPAQRLPRIPLVSTGVSLRINLFGMLVLEPFYAIPFQLGGMEAAYFGLNFTPGW
jgi:Tol biopolymer transport system component